MKTLILFGILTLSLQSFAQSSMRRCTLLPITDSVGGAIGYKVFEEVERELKKSNWCTYVSNSGLISVFSRYRENLPQYLKTKQVLSSVAEKLKVGSLILVSLKHELNGVDAELNVWGENGEDLYFSERSSLNNDDVELITQTVKSWLDMYAKMIPYDARVNGVLGDQITLDVGKGYPINIAQKFIVKRPVRKKKHPLLKKIVDWETEVLAEGKISNISDNQALGLVKSNRPDKKIVTGDWVRLEEFKGEELNKSKNDENKSEEPGTLGVLSVGLIGSSSSVDTLTPSGSKRLSGNLLGIDFRVEGWITREYFAAFEIEKMLGTFKGSSGSPAKDSVHANNSIYKYVGGYRYLPIGFFYGPQIDIYGGYAGHVFDLELSRVDGFGRSSITGIMVGTAANIPINRDWRFFGKGEFIPFPTFKDEDNIYGSPSSVNALELELGMKYQYQPRMTIDGSLNTLSRKAKFKGSFKEISYQDNRFKVGVSFNF